MESVQPLIDKASKVCGGDSALAEKMGIPRQNVYLMRAGKRPISPATAAELADIAGDDAREAAIAAVIESAKGTRRESVLREILGKAIAAGVAGLLVYSYSGDSISTMETIAAKADTTLNPIHRILYLANPTTVSHRSIWTLLSAGTATIIAHDTSHTSPLHIPHPLRPS